MKDDTSEIWTPTRYNDGPKICKDKASYMSWQSGGSIVKTIWLNFLWVEIGRKSDVIWFFYKVRLGYLWSIYKEYRIASASDSAVLDLLKMPVTKAFGYFSPKFQE